LVRCGACKLIFNGIEHLVRQDEAPQVTATSRPDDIPAAPPASTVELATEQLSTVPAATDASATVPAPEQKPASAVDFVSMDSADGAAGEAAPATETPVTEMAEALPLAAAADNEDPLQRMTLVNFTGEEDKTADRPAAEGPEPAAQPAERQDAAPTQMTATPPAADMPHSPQSHPAEVDENLVPEPSSYTPLYKKSTDSSRPTEQPDDETVAAEDNDAEATDEEPGFVIHGRKRQRNRRIARIFMSVASVILLFGLAAQGAYVFRNQLAAWFPQMKPALSQICQAIGCQVKLPAQIDMVSIESSELQALAANKNIFTLTLLLRNRSTVAQHWPDLELTLNDANEKPVVRKVLTPRDYLPSAQEIAKGFSASSEQPVKITFELTQLKASGYRIYLFYP
jgi:hypothetical protein